MRRFAYFPGCWLTTTTRDFDRSTRALARALDWDLVDFDWNCCGDFGLHLTDEAAGQVMAARNLALAEALEADLLMPCAGCFRYQEETRQRLARDEALREKVEELIAAPLAGSIRCLPLLAAIDEERTALGSRVVHPLSSLKIACFYGCRLSRPAALLAPLGIHGRGAMERLLEAAGADPVTWSHGAECCGAFHSVPRPDIVTTRVALIRAGADAAGAEAIAVSCPWCFRNLTFYQQAPELPVFHVAQLLGLALDCSPAEVGLPSARRSPLLSRIMRSEG